MIQRLSGLVLAFCTGCGGRTLISLETSDSAPISTCSAGTRLGDVTIRTAAELRSLEGVGEITGNVTITGEDVVSLDALGCLGKIDGNLTVGQCDFAAGNYEGPARLQSLEGLDHLRTVAGALQICGAPLLTSLALPALETAGALVIVHNESLKEPFESSHLTRTGWLLIDHNALISLHGLDRLQEVTCNTWIAHEPHLDSLRGLDAIVHTDALTVAWNTRLSTLAGLSALTSVGDGSACSDDTADYAWHAAGLDFSRLESLKSLEGLLALERVAGTLRLVDNARLQDLDGAPSLKELGGLEIQLNPLLTNVDGLYSLQTLAPNVNIQSCAKLDNLRGLTNATWTTPKPGSSYSGISIADNPKLTSLQGLAPTGALDLISFVDNDGLLGGGDWTQVSSVGALSIVGNDALTSLSFLDAMRSSVGDCRISDNSSLPGCEATRLQSRWRPSGIVQICGNLPDACTVATCANSPAP